MTKETDMPRVEVLTEVSESDARAVVTEQQEINADNGGSAVAAPARSVRRATARRASDRRATAPSRQVDRAQEEAAAIADQIALEPGGERDQVTPSAWFG
jgi:hypothetical protein